MSTRVFNVNNKTYVAKEFTFNLLCDLEDQGLSLEDIEKKPMSLIRTYVAFCGNVSKEVAGREIEAHVTSGNKLNDILEVLSEEMNNSGFFRSLRENSEKEEGETQEEDSEETSPKKRGKASK